MTACRKCRGLGNRIDCPVPCTQDMMIDEVWNCQFFRPFDPGAVIERIWAEDDYSPTERGWMTKLGVRREAHNG